MRLAERVARLEQSGPLGADAQHARDAAMFDAHTTKLAEAMSPDARAEARRSWAIGRAMLRTFPGSALALAGCTIEDWNL